MNASAAPLLSRFRAMTALWGGLLYIIVSMVVNPRRLPNPLARKSSPRKIARLEHAERMSPPFEHPKNCQWCEHSENEEFYDGVARRANAKMPNPPKGNAGIGDARRHGVSPSKYVATPKPPPKVKDGGIGNIHRRKNSDGRHMNALTAREYVQNTSLADANKETFVEDRREDGYITFTSGGVKYRANLPH